MNPKKWFLSKRGKRARSRDRRDGGLQERLTVMLVPAAAWGKPLQFQVRKKTLLTVVGLSVASVVLVGIGLVWLVASGLSGAGKSRPGAGVLIESQTEVVSLKEENRRLKVELRDHVRETRDRIGQVTRLVARISDFTGLPLDVSTTTVAASAPTSESALLRLAPQPGRGGPVSASVDAIIDALQGHGSRGYARIREIQQYQLDSIIVRLQRAARHFSEQQDLLLTTPLICPIKGDWEFTDRFGKRTHPLSKQIDFHNGLDIAAAHGAPIMAPAAGRVSYAGFDKARGRTLTIDHGTGLYPHDGGATKEKFETRYFHCSKVLVKKGATVKRGDVIGLVGSTGISTGPHLHYEVHVNDKPVDPEYFILDAR